MTERELTLPCADLQETLKHFTERLGFRLDVIVPADEPRIAVVSRDGVRVRLDAGAGAAEYGLASTPRLAALAPDVAVTSGAAGGAFHEGRAGMLYRDLVPGRLGGHFIASHIRIPDGGPVPDSVHFHTVRFQAIYCHRGWVRVVYEDQGPELVLREGDCVLQPPGIRHRVLESSDGLEVIEVGAPAVHETTIDHDLELPTATVDAMREFGGQRFVHHVATASSWHPEGDGVEVSDFGFGEATGDVATMRRVRATREIECAIGDDDGIGFVFALAGPLELRAVGHDATPLAAGDAAGVAATHAHVLATAGAEWLEVRTGACR